jgi:hypothetical protein
MAARAVARCGALSAAIDHKLKTRKHNLFSRKPFQINANSDPNTNPIPEVTIRRITARTTSNGYRTYIGLMKCIQKTKSITTG